MIGKPKSSLKRWCRNLLVILALMVLALGGFVWHLVAHHNFHIITAGRMYRSAQMDAEGFSRVIQEQNIKSILNLRGQDMGQSWYQAETSTARRLGVAHYDFALSAGQEVNDAEIDRILETIIRAPKPMLIHCKSGADRTGLIGALYLYSVEGEAPESADRELTIFYGHVPYLFWRDTVAMDRSFWRYVRNHGRPSNAGRLQTNNPVTKKDSATYVVHDAAEAAAR